MYCHIKELRKHIQKHIRYYPIGAFSIPEIESMIRKNEENGTSFEKLATVWFEKNRDKVDQMIGK
ncbi:hypothetical protein [Virgibacillus sp. L01]|uniref:hypothetical protein n=1 Tax=Virgibacillus sp. L01 TaxID=3457429 RepID=UPI003FCF0183